MSEPVMREREGFIVAGISCRTSNATPQEIGALWQKFYAAGGPAQIRGRQSDEVYAVYSDYAGDHTQPYTLTIGCVVPRADDLAAGQVARVVPQQRYAVFDASGEQPSTLMATWRRVWETPIARAFTVDFDHYRDANRVHIHVAVR